MATTTAAADYSTDQNEYYNYQKSLDKLNELQSVNSMSQKNSDLVKKRLVYTLTMCKKLNINENEFNKLKIIHITGTKGKGSCSAFIESLLRNSGYKTGLFSSPHLIEVRERFKVKGKALSYGKFSKYFDYCYEQIIERKTTEDDYEKPSYFQLLTCMMFHVFLQENVDVAIVEVGIGGQFDFTNIIPNPIACGITSLGLDHCEILGKTLEEIAWQKSGIFKASCVAFTLQHDYKPALDVIKERAIEKNIPLCLVPHVEHYMDENGKEVELGLNGEVQYINSSLALQIAKYWIDYKNNENLDKSKWIEAHTDRILESNNLPLLKPVFINEPFANGLSKCFWPGRNQIIESENKKVTYYLDGAHTVESIEQFVNWFKSIQQKNPNAHNERNVLLFNITGERNPSNFFLKLLGLNSESVAFSKLEPFPQNNDGSNKDVVMKMPKSSFETTNKYENLVKSYLELYNENLSKDENDNLNKKNKVECKVFDNILESLVWLTKGADPNLTKNLNNFAINHQQQAESNSQLKKTNVLITGSLYLVGLSLKVLDFKTC